MAESVFYYKNTIPDQVIHDWHSQKRYIKRKMVTVVIHTLVQTLAGYLATARSTSDAGPARGHVGVFEHTFNLNKEALFLPTFFYIFIYIQKDSLIVRRGIVAVGSAR